MARLLKGALLVALVFGLVWLGVVIWWQQSNRVVSPTDVLVWMGLLPLVLIGGFFAARGLYRVATRPPSADGSKAAGGKGGAAATPSPKLEAPLAVLATGFAGAAGDAADAAAASLRGGEYAPELDPKVRDADGFPVLTARHAALDPADAEAWLDAQDRSDTNSTPDADERERLLRLLAVLDVALQPVTDALLPLFPPRPPDLSARERNALPPPSRLALLLIDADRLSPAALAMQERFVRERLLAASPELVPTSLGRAPADGDLAVFQLVNRLMVSAPREPQPTALLILGADSALDEASLSDWRRREAFHGAKRPEAAIPGEAAAAILLFGAAPDRLPENAIAALHAGVVGTRDTSADAKGQVFDQVLRAVATSALESGQCKPEDCALVLADGGHARSRAAESAMAMSTLFPTLDPVKDCIDLGRSLGALGAARLPALLALGTASVVAEDKPVLVAGLADPKQRFAVLFTPPAPAASST